MASYIETLRVRSKERIQVIDITGDVEAIVRRSGISEGICLVHLPHATAALVANENERGLINDMIRKIREEFVREGWEHDRIDDNAYAHLASSFIGPSRAFPVFSGRILRGTWQSILLIELDGPRERNVVVTVVG
ncbi:YjbQ family protein [Candidatus Korarchaeum cryptofilum]|uniref:YjbQ family protein n=1 Tax=Candidatus Korarchaeum cryptofilum TaxID=498846 RepID=A0A3R9Q7R1_9CREN|nr:secondary thiamine-phosphate synthase enzyme YjbQ [Candidatus Korarchaeum cryptofilum]RSN67075.1 YjbQ family protein [Candidatus Korarchaeum cryptofilum]